MTAAHDVRVASCVIAGLCKAPPNSWVKLRAAQPKKPSLTQGGTQRRGARARRQVHSRGALPGPKVPGVELCGDGQEGRSMLALLKLQRAGSSP